MPKIACRLCAILVQILWRQVGSQAQTEGAVMAKKEPDMSKDLISIRSLIDKKSLQTISEWADAEGRSQQQHTYVLLRRLAALFRENPEGLEKLGLLTPFI